MSHAPPERIFVDEISPDAPNPPGRRDTGRVILRARTSITYVFDAHCPWCHAVTPTVIAAAERRPDLRVDVVHGRLLPHPAPLGTLGWYAPTAASVRGLTRVEFGRGFDAALADGTASADSDSAAAAFVAMRSVAPDLALDIASAMHRALFLDGRELTDVDTVLDIAATLGLSPDRVWGMLANPLVGRLAAVEQARVAASGLDAYPGLFVQVGGPDGPRDVPVTTRLRTVDQVLDAIDTALRRSLAGDV